MIEADILAPEMYLQCKYSVRVGRPQIKSCTYLALKTKPSWTSCCTENDRHGIEAQVVGHLRAS